MGLPPVTNCNYPEMALSSKNCGSTSLALQLLPASGDRPSGYVYSFFFSLSLALFFFFPVKVHWDTHDFLQKYEQKC